MLLVTFQAAGGKLGQKLQNMKKMQIFRKNEPQFPNL